MKLSFIMLVLLQTQQLPATRSAAVSSVPIEGQAAPVSTPLEAVEYRLGQNDLLEVTVFEAPELGGTIRVTAAGLISLPLVGPLSASGKTARDLELEIEEVLKRKYVNDPHVVVFIREFASQPVSILGAVKGPGIYQIKGQKRLLDMLAMAQGLADGAGKSIQIIRPPAPSGQPISMLATNAGETITIDVVALFEQGDTTLNVPIYAGDVINVLRAGSVFVIGEVNGPGEFVLRNGRGITVTQAVALGSGFTKESKKSEAVIIRYHTATVKEEIPVDVDKILKGEANDVPLLANDILFIPTNRVKSGLNRALDAAISIVTGQLVFLGRN